MMDLEFRSEDLFELRRIRPQDRVDVRELPLVDYATLMVCTWDRPWSYMDLIFLAWNDAKN